MIQNFHAKQELNKYHNDDSFGFHSLRVVTLSQIGQAEFSF